ncbi:HNH endonuclease [Paenibacillus sp. 32352]|uniref:HNH endonuclease n=1 Tax=Paenibacillus sp. 32352 TaxID=1969111 RepID=UPI0009AE31CE|nr:HNH endonuclease [Paenibacillus sp. 32352]
MTITSIPTGKDPVVNSWLHKLGRERAEQWLKDRGAKTTWDDHKQTHYVHGDNEESIKITVRWHYEGVDKPTEGSTVNASQNLPSQVSHVLLVRTYHEHKGFLPEYCYFTFIPKALADRQQVVAYTELKKGFIYELIPQKHLDTYPYSNQWLQRDTVKEMEDVSKEVESMPLSATEKEHLIKARIGQGKFKRDLLKLSDKCRLCSVSDERFLIASHIKPWSKCDLSDERIDPYNGFLFCPNHDSLFDKGLISFEDSGKIMISPSLDKTTKQFLNINDTDVITLESRHVPYLKWHRQRHKDKL